MLSFLAVDMFQGSAYSQTVTATLAESSDAAVPNVTLTPAATLQGFAANKSGTVIMKVFSIKNDGVTKRLIYTNQTHTITTNATGGAIVQGTAGTKDYDFVELDEGYPQNQNPPLNTL